MARIQVWEGDGDLGDPLCSTISRCEALKAEGLLGDNPRLLLEFEAETWLEAQERFHDFMGYEPFVPRRDENGKVWPEYFEKLED